MKEGREDLIELTYSYQLARWCYVQPDVQYVVRPSGTDELVPNALVFVLRLGVEL